MKTSITIVLFSILIAFTPIVTKAQMKVLESERSDSTKYATEGTIQDSIYIVYKSSNGDDKISIYADLNNTDSLVFDWYKFNNTSKTFDLLVSYDTLTQCILNTDSLNQTGFEFEGGYRLNIHNQEKNIDTTFTIWLWYQNFFINDISIYNSTCDEITFLADTSFRTLFRYYDLSVAEKPELLLSNKTILEWNSNPGNETKYGNNPRFLAPYEATTYTLTAVDDFNFERETQKVIDESSEDKDGFPIMRAVKAKFKGIHGIETAENTPDTAMVQVEAPHGVWFTNESINGDAYEWIFYNHQDWRRGTWDTILHVSELFEPFDSIYYERPKKTETSPDGYDVKLNVWGPVYKIDGNLEYRCLNAIRGTNFVMVDSTKFPASFKELPNVFTPGKEPYETFHFVDKDDDTNKPVYSIRYFSIKIYNRWGNKVYEYEDNDGSWQEDGHVGWDGRTRVGTMAKPGVYYYAIEAIGWDGRLFNSKNNPDLAGYVHIF